MSSLFMVSLALLAGVSCSTAIEQHGAGDDSRNPALMHTNIKLVGIDPATAGFHELHDIVIEPSTLLEKANLVNVQDDIEEDPEDPFITTASGRTRPKFQTGPEAEDWSEDVSPPSLAHIPLKRVKRCGDGGGGGNGDANRARRNRGRRSRRNRSTAKTTTTVTRHVYQNGQLVSSNTVAGQNTLPAANVVTVPAAVQHVPAVQHVNHVPTVQAAAIPQHQVVPVQQPAQIVHPVQVPAAPVAQVIPQQVAPIQQQAIPNISVKGSVDLQG